MNVKVIHNETEFIFGDEEKAMNFVRSFKKKNPEKSIKGAFSYKDKTLTLQTQD